MVAGVRRASEPQHRPRCLARSRRSRRPGGASVGRAIVRGQGGKPESTVASFRRVVIFDLQHGAKSCRAGSLALCLRLKVARVNTASGRSFLNFLLPRESIFLIVFLNKSSASRSPRARLYSCHLRRFE